MYDIYIINMDTDTPTGIVNLSSIKTLVILEK